MLILLALVLIVLLVTPRYATRWHQWRYGGISVEKDTEYVRCPDCGLRMPDEIYAEHRTERHSGDGTPQAITLADHEPRAIWLWLAVGFGVLCIPWALADGNPFMAAVFVVGVLYGGFRLWSRRQGGAT